MTDYNRGYEKLEAAEKEIAYLKERYSEALEREKQLLAQLSLLQWTAIEEENLPKAGDEVLRIKAKDASWFRIEVVAHNWDVGWLQNTLVYLEYRRPINPPAPPTDKEQK